MPENVKKALDENHLMQDYLAHPEYQRNDYLGWIERAKREEKKKSGLIKC